MDSRGRRGGRLADLYGRHADTAGRLAYLLTGDRALAEDLVQEAFVRAARRLAHLRDAEAFPAYLRRTVVNLAISHFRHRRVERHYVAGQPRGEALEESVEAKVAEHERMREALLVLPERQRAAIVLRYYEDLPDARIAEVLRCREGTVRSLVSRGVTTLREVLAMESEES